MYSGLDPDLSQNLTLQVQVQVWALVKAPEVLALAWVGVWAAVLALVRVVARAQEAAVAGPVPPCGYPSPRGPQRAWAIAAAQADRAVPRHGRPEPRR